MAMDWPDLIVVDAKSGNNITRQVLTLIIVEEESKGGRNLLPTNFLFHSVSLYCDSLQFLVPRYLIIRWDSPCAIKSI